MKIFQTDPQLRLRKSSRKRLVRPTSLTRMAIDHPRRRKYPYATGSFEDIKFQQQQPTIHDEICLRNERLGAADAVTT